MAHVFEEYEKSELKEEQHVSEVCNNDCKPKESLEKDDCKIKRFENKMLLLESNI